MTKPDPESRAFKDVQGNRATSLRNERPRGNSHDCEAQRRSPLCSLSLDGHEAPPTQGALQIPITQDNVLKTKASHPKAVL